MEGKFEGKFENKFEDIACACGKPLDKEGHCINSICVFFGTIPPKEKQIKIKLITKRSEGEADYLLRHMMSKEPCYVLDKTTETTREVEKKEVLSEETQKIVNEINSEFKGTIDWWVKKWKKDKYYIDKIKIKFDSDFVRIMVREKISEPWEQYNILEKIEVPPEGKEIFEDFKEDKKKKLEEWEEKRK